MKSKLINELQNVGFKFVKSIPAKHCVVLAMPDEYHEDDETFYDSSVGSEIVRPHYFGKRVDIVGNRNDAIASIYKHDDQQEVLIKKFHFYIDVEDKKFRQKFRMLINTYNKVF